MRLMVPSANRTQFRVHLLSAVFVLCSTFCVSSAVSAQELLSKTVKIDDSTVNGPVLANADSYGSSVASLGDLDGDGVPDTAVGAYVDDTGGSNRGAVQISYLNTDGSVKSTVKIDDNTGNGPVLANEDTYGASLASLGDLDGDGVTDIAVGATGDDAGGSNRGGVHISYLNADGSVKSTAKIDDNTVNGPVLADSVWYGSSVASLGDLDGDGVTDIAVGAMLDSTGGTLRGAVYISYLNADGSVKNTVKIASGTPNGPVLADDDRYGSSVASLGDLDGDGVTDIAVGASQDGTGGLWRGAVHISYLNADGSVKKTVKIDSSTPGGPVLQNSDYYGTSLASLGDLDGDGVAEIAAGAQEDSTGGSSRGALHISFLKADGSVKSTVKIASGSINGPVLATEDRYGRSVASLGDLDGDGLAEIAVGAFNDDTGGANRGAVHISSLALVKSTVKIDATTANGPVLADGDRYGTSIASLGDLDGDGVTDTVVGAFFDGTGGSFRGAVHISYLNADGSVKRTAKIDDNTANGPVLADQNYYGLSVASLGDLDGDGVTDIVVGASGDSTGGNARGAVHISYLNADGSVKSTAKIDDNTVNGPVLADSNRYGSSVASLGDLDGDGVTDIAVGANEDSTGGALRGAVYISYLNADGSVKNTVKIASGTPNGPVLADFHRYGTSVASLSDLDGDGVTDIAVGARQDDTGGTWRGAVHISYLNADGSVKSTVKIDDNTANGPTLLDGDRYGSAIASFGDLDGDGVADIAVGAYGDDTGGSARGAVHISYLNADGSVKSTVKIASGTVNGPVLSDVNWYGVTVAALGDLDGDGHVEIAVGAYSDDAGGTDRGAVHISKLNLGHREIEVRGNGVRISNADTTPRAEDDTDFGAVMLGASVKGNFSVVNPGSVSLTLTGTPEVTLSGANPGDFFVTIQPEATVRAPLGSNRFVIEFAPSASGLRTATVSIASNDADENLYTFTIQGTGLDLVDTDGDGIPNTTDPDDDNDGLSDADETANGTDPLDPDSDNDEVNDGQEVVDRTDPNDPDSYIEHADGEYCLDWNGFLSHLSQIAEYRNASGAALGLRVELRDIEGAVQSSVSFTLAASEQRDLIVNDLSGFEPNTYGTICAIVTSGLADGLDAQLSTYEFTGTSFNFAYAIPYVVPRSGAQYLMYNHFYPSRDAAELGNARYGFVQISNEESTLQTGELVFYDFQGVELRRVAMIVPAKGRRDIDTHTVGVDTVGMLAWLPTSPSASFRVVLSRYYFSSASRLIAVAAIPAKRGIGAEIVSAFDTAAKVAVVELSNTTGAPITAQVFVNAATGAATAANPLTVNIPAMGTRHVVLNEYVDNGTGNVQVSSSAVGSLIAETFEYGLNAAQGLAFVANAPALKPEGRELRVSYNNFLGGCVLRLANSSSAAVASSLSMTRYDGTNIPVSTPVNVPANGVLEVDICANETASAYGEVLITPATHGAISADMLRSNEDSSAEFRVSATLRTLQP